ncbi:MAG TPA: hypothetical protein VF974_05095 [Patescibacteria group bacterium]
MKELLDKLDTYKLFNYLLPGVLFVVLLDKFMIHSFTWGDLLVGAFVCYFIGLVISRFGSLFIEPFLKKISFLKFADYKDFVNASEKDSKIEILSEANNMYRTFISLFVLLILGKIYKQFESVFPQLSQWNFYIISILLLSLFLFSYKKQTAYIKKRIETNNT